MQRSEWEPRGLLWTEAHSFSLALSSLHLSLLFQERENWQIINRLAYKCMWLISDVRSDLMRGKFLGKESGGKVKGTILGAKNSMLATATATALAAIMRVRGQDSIIITHRKTAKSAQEFYFHDCHQRTIAVIWGSGEKHQSHWVRRDQEIFNASPDYPEVFRFLNSLSISCYLEFPFLIPFQIVLSPFTYLQLHRSGTELFSSQWIRDTNQMLPNDCIIPSVLIM